MSASLYCAPSVQPALRIKIGGVGVFWFIEATQKNTLFSDVNNRRPSIPCGVPVYAQEPTSASRPSRPQVLHVHGWGNIPKVFYSVVVGIAIYVINLSCGPLTIGKKPRKTMRKVQPAFYGDKSVSITINATGGPIFWSAMTLPKPPEFTSLGVVVKKLAQTLRGKIGLSHDAVLSRIGQRPACVSAHGGLHYFSLEQE